MCSARTSTENFKSKDFISHFTKLSELMSTILLIILSGVTNCAYGTLFPLLHYFEGVWKTAGEFSWVLELKFQKQDSHFSFL